MKMLVEEKAKELSEFLEKDFKGKVISEADKYTIDSVVEDRYRILVAHLKEPVPKEKGGEGLAEFNVWGGDEELILDKVGIKYPERGEISNLLGIGADELTERQVFVRIQGQTFNITEQVREVSKQIYTKLVDRELRPSRRREDS